MTFRDPIGRNPFGQFGSGSTGPEPNAVYDSILPVIAQVYTPSEASLPVEAIVEYPWYDSVLPVRAEVYTPSEASLPVLAQVYGDITNVHRPIVMLGGVDVSALLVGDIRIKFAEDASATAYFTIRPADGIIDLPGWWRAAVTIDHKDGASIVRKFTGEVSTPAYDPNTGLVKLDCSSDLQGKMERATRAQIDALTPGALYSADVSDDSGDNWQYAQERMKTLPGSLWTDRSGAVRYTPWAAKETPDLVLQQRDILPGTLQIKSASARQMVNRVRIGMDYRYYNLRQREVSYHLRPPSVCDLLQGLDYKLPTKAQVREAAEGTGWTLQSIHYTELYPSGVYTCDSQEYILVNAGEGQVCVGASFTLSKRWAQRVTEDYLLDVRADDSIDAIGEMGVVESYGIESDYDYSDWEQTRKYIGSGQAALAHPGGSGDKAGEADPQRRTEMELAQQVKLAMADTEIKGSHRGTQVTFKTKTRFDLDPLDTVEIQHSKVDVRAAVDEIEELISVKTGEATATVTLAVSLHQGVGGGSASPLDPPERPEATPEPTYARTIPLLWRVGPVDAIEYGGLTGIKGLTGELNLGEDAFSGYSYNDPSVTDPSKVKVQEGMTVAAPQIDAAYVDSTVLQAEQVYQVIIPQDLFVLRK